MPVITALEPQQRRAGRTNVYIDGHFTIGVADDIVARMRLRIGESVDEDRLRSLSQAEDQHAATELALRFLEHRPRTRREIAQRLTRAEFAADIVESALAKLTDLGLVNDPAFAEQWVDAKSRPTSGRPAGRRRIVSDLQRKGIDKETIETAVSSVSDGDELELARSALQSKARSLPEDPAERIAEKRRLTGFLARRGFGWETIRKALQEHGQGDDDEE